MANFYAKYNGLFGGGGGGGSGGDVVGPASSTDSAVALFDGTTGKLLKNSVVIVDGSGNMTGIGTATVGNLIDSGLTASQAVVTDGSKQLASVARGNLSAVGTDGIAVTSGTSAVFGAGTSIAQQVADTSHNGYLNSTDWNTFNGKQAAGSYITALTGDGTASGPGSATLTLATVNGNVGSFTNASITVNAKGLITAASNGAADTGITQLTGDVTAGPGSGSQAATLATVNGNVGTFGSSTSIPTVTVNAKGLVTAASGNAVIAPAGTLTGNTLASGVVTSSLTTVGTIGTGVWAGTTIAVDHGGTGQTSYTNGQILIGNTSGNTLAKATITAGTGITITNGAGTITIAVTGGGTTSTELVSYTPTVTGLGTVSNVNFFWQRIADKLYVTGTLTAGTVSASLASFTLPGALAIDTAKTISNTTAQVGPNIGTWGENVSATSAGYMISAAGTSTTIVYIGGIFSSTSMLAAVTGLAVVTSTQTLSVQFSVPISGWTNNN